MRPSLLLAIATVVFTSSLLAATHTWHGGADNRFSNAKNWNGGSPADDPGADLTFSADALRAVIENDTPNLHIHSLAFGGPGFAVIGEPLAVDNGFIGGGGAAIYCDIAFSGKLALGGVAIYSAIGGSGPVTISGDVTFAGPRSNTYTGDTIVGSVLTLAKTSAAIAVPGNIRSAHLGQQFIVVGVAAPEQIADSATVDLSAGGRLHLAADETIHALSTGEEISQATADPVNHTLTVESLTATGDVRVDTNLNITGPELQVPRSISGTKTLTIPASGLTMRGGGSMDWRSGATYSAPVRVDGPSMQVLNSNGPVELISGKFSGSAKSLTATGGTIEYIAKSATDIRANASTRFEYFATFDGDFTPITLNGTLDLGNAQLVLDPNAKRRSGLSTWTLIQNASTQPVIGTFNGLPEGAIAGNRWRISYHGGDGNDVTLTDLQHPLATVALSQTPSPGIVGQPVTITAMLTGSNGTPTGTVTFLPAGQAPVEVPIANGTATLQATYDQPVAGIFATYNGDATYATNTTFFDLKVAYPKPVVTSTTPAEVVAGTRVMVVIHGTGFVPQSAFTTSAPVGLPVFTTTYVSPVELRAVLDLRYLTAPTSLFFRVTHPAQLSTSSDLVRINAKPASIAPPAIQFDSTSVSATMTAGGSSAWISSDATRTTNFIIDDDLDGVVRWTFGSLPTAAFTVVDLNNATFATKTSGNATAAVAPIPAHTFVYDPSGYLTRIALPVTGANPSSTWTVLWVRRFTTIGTGAWTTTISGTTLLTGSIDTMQPLGDSPAHPDVFWEGDIVIFMPRGASGTNIPVFAGIIGDLRAGAPGILQMQSSQVAANEGDKVARVPVIRDDSAGTVSVHYRTVPHTIPPGPHYSDVTGVLTLAPGETAKNIEVPLVDDAIYDPSSFDVQLFDPSGTSLREPSQTRVDVADNDPRPVISVVGPAIRTVLRNPQLPSTLQLDLQLTGATALPVTLGWQASGAAAGSLVFAPGEHRKTLLIAIPPPTNSIAVDLLSVSLTVASGGATLRQDHVAISLVPATLVHIRASAVSVSENGGSAKVTVSYVPPVPANQGVTLNYQTVDGSAAAGSDYTAVHGSITLSTAQPQQTIDIPITDDAAAEGDESFTLSLTKAFTNDSFLEQSSVPIVIADDEVTERPSLSIAGEASFAETDDLMNAQIEVRLSAASTRPVRVHYATADGSATGGIDYQTMNDVLTFAPGETVKAISIPIFGDDLIESAKSFTVTLSAAENATIGTAQSTVTIVDDDQPIPHRRAGGR